MGGPIQIRTMAWRVGVNLLSSLLSWSGLWFPPLKLFPGAAFFPQHELKLKTSGEPVNIFRTAFSRHLKIDPDSWKTWGPLGASLLEL